MKICLGGLLAIVFDEAYLKNRTNQWINDIIIFYNEHMFQCYNINISNRPE